MVEVRSRKDDNQNQDLIPNTQEKLAANLGVTFPTINRWENGRAKPSPLALKQIEDLLRGLGDRGKDLLQEFFPEEER